METKRGFKTSIIKLRGFRPDQRTKILKSFFVCSNQVNPLLTLNSGFQQQLRPTKKFSNFIIATSEQNCKHLSELFLLTWTPICPRVPRRCPPGGLVGLGPL